MINYFKAAERTLLARPDFDRALENLKARREGVVNHGRPEGVRTIDTTRPYVSGGGVSDTVADLVELAELDREIAATVAAMEAVDRVLAQLQQDEAAIIKAWYIDRATKDEIASQLNYSSTSTIYAHRNKAVSAFAVLYFGAGALASV